MKRNISPEQETTMMTRGTTLTALTLATLLGAGSLTLGLARAHDRGMMGGGMGHGMMGGMGGGMAAMMPDFEALDTDGDGKVTEAEFQAHRRMMIEAADADGDGTISATELADHMEAQMQARKAERMGQMLQRMDGDGDGKVSIDEMLNGPRQGPIARLDADGDGALSAEEYAAAGARMAQRGGEGARGHGHGRGHGGMMGGGWWPFGNNN
ncbi:MAG: EF-hand domain-containing protein [Paracoccaceae bacterium]